MSYVCFIKTGWRVIYKGRLTQPWFQDKGGALAYKVMLDRGQKKPKYAGD